MTYRIGDKLATKAGTKITIMSVHPTAGFFCESEFPVSREARLDGKAHALPEGTHFWITPAGDWTVIRDRDGCAQGISID